MINTTASSIASFLWAIFNIYVVIDMLISMWKLKKEKQILLDTIEDYQEEIDDLTAFNHNWEINYCDLMDYIEHKDNIIEELQDKLQHLKKESKESLDSNTEESVPDSKL